MDQWILNGGKVLGKQHKLMSLPCQDSYKYKRNNDVTVIVLSDGCSSAPLSEDGARITTDLLCELFCNEFDKLYEMYNNNPINLKTFIVQKICEAVSKFAHQNITTVKNTIDKDPERKTLMRENFSTLVDDAYFNKVYPLTLYDATVQFIAVKDNNVIVGRLGDGVICSIEDKAAIILSSEDKINVKNNETWYPTSFLLLRNNLHFKKVIDANFEIIKEENITNDSTYFIMSDGVADAFLIDENKTKRIDYYFLDKLLEATNIEKFLITEIQKFKNIRDDLSITIMSRGDTEFDRVVIRQYSENGRTVSNNKISYKIDEINKDEVITQTDEIENVPKNKVENSNNEIIKAYTIEDLELKTSYKKYIESVKNNVAEKELNQPLYGISNDQLTLIVEYLSNDNDYCNKFLQQLSIINKVMKDNKQISCENLYHMVANTIDEYDFMQLLDYIDAIGLYKVTDDFVIKS